MASVPFLSCKFFALQKTYGIIAAGIHAGPAAPAMTKSFGLAGGLCRSKARFLPGRVKPCPGLHTLVIRFEIEYSEKI
jgi:hypothetical protein